MGDRAAVHGHGVLGNVALQDHDAHPRPLRVLHGLPELPVRGVVGDKPFHSLHLDDHNKISFVSFLHAFLQSPDVFEAALGGGVGEHAYPVFFQRDPLHLGEYLSTIGFNVEVEAGVPVDLFRVYLRAGSEAA